MKHATLVAIGICVVACITRAQGARAALELRFCGQQSLHAYPLSTEAGLQGLLLQLMAVVNRGDQPIEVTSVDLELLRDGLSVDTRRLEHVELDALGQLGEQLEATSSARKSIALLCDEHLLPEGVALGARALTGRHALLILNQAFAFGGRRDSLRITAIGSAGDSPVETSAVLPISTAMSETRYRLPLKGVWVIKSGPSFHTHHRWALPSEFAFDFVKVGVDGRSHRNDGTRFTDYYAYGQDVLAAADGRVIRTVDDQPEPTHLLLRPGETFAVFSQRTAAYQQEMLEGGSDRISGNHVIVDHGNGEYGLYAHLQAGSVRVRAGDAVKAAQPIAKVGGSGNALVEPHLHFHVCDRPAPLACAGIPLQFTDVALPFASFAPRPLQSGDIVMPASGGIPD